MMSAVPLEGLEDCGARARSNFGTFESLEAVLTRQVT